MNRLNKFYKLINNLELINHGSHTQLTSSTHEINCNKILIDTFLCESISNKDFRKLIINNNKKMISKPAKETDLNRQCDKELIILNNVIGLKDNTNYLISQPAGQHEYPDFILARFTSNKLLMTFIECKQTRPTFNNNTPKMRSNCIYICGNNIFNGLLLSTPEIENKRNEYKRKLIELSREYTDINTKCVPYKKMELPWNIDQGPSCFIERKDQNMSLINDCFIKYVSDEVSVQSMEEEQHSQSE